MGKKSLIKSTAKKKTEPKKAGETKTKKAAAKTTKKTAAKTTKKAAAKTTKKATAKAAKPAAKSKSAAKKLSVKELTFLKFEPVGPVPAKVAAPQPAAATPTAPPLITAQDAGEADRLHALLAKKFSMDEVKAAAKAPVITAASKVKEKPAAKKLSLLELISLKFEPIGPVPAKVPAPQPAAAAPTAPPLITAQDAGEADRLHALLAKKFNMDEVKAAAKAPAEKPAAEPPAAEAETETPGAPEKAPAPEAAAPPAEPEPAAQTEPEEAPAAEVSEPAPQPKAAEPPAPEPQPVMKPAQVARKTVVTPPKPAPEAEPAQPMPAAAYTNPEPQSDPVVRSAKIAGAAAVLVIFILLAVSAVNSGKYYIKPIDNAIEIWKGDFSPKDNSFFMVLHGVQAPEPPKSVYAKKDVYPIIFKYYLDKSDTLLDVEGLPDFEGIKKYLHKAQDFAINNEMESAVKERLNTIDRMVMLYKADVAISRNTEDSLESAIDILKDAGKLTSNATQDEEIAQKIELARKKIEALKTPATAPEAAAPAENTENTEATEAAAQHPNE
jgi:colicin import membrane protein